MEFSLGRFTMTLVFVYVLIPLIITQFKPSLWALTWHFYMIIFTDPCNAIQPSFFPFLLTWIKHWYRSIYYFSLIFNWYVPILFCVPKHPKPLLNYQDVSSAVMALFFQVTDFISYRHIIFKYHGFPLRRGSLEWKFKR